MNNFQFNNSSPKYEDKDRILNFWTLWYAGNFLYTVEYRQMSYNKKIRLNNCRRKPTALRIDQIQIVQLYVLVLKARQYSL